MQTNHPQYAALILKKLKQALNITTDVELSEILKVKPNTISTWKKRNTMDYACIIGICGTYGVDLNQLFLDTLPESSIPKTYYETTIASGENQVNFVQDLSTLPNPGENPSTQINTN